MRLKKLTARQLYFADIHHKKFVEGDGYISTTNMDFTPAVVCKNPITITVMFTGRVNVKILTLAPVPHF